MNRNRTLEEIQEDIRTLTRVPSEFIHAKLNELAEEVAELTKPKWIPCSERLPDKPEHGENGYIVQRKRVAEPFSAYWNGERWTNEDDSVIDKVIAWMPLPETYKGECEDA